MDEKNATTDNKNLKEQTSVHDITEEIQQKLI